LDNICGPWHEEPPKLSLHLSMVYVGHGIVNIIKSRGGTNPDSTNGIKNQVLFK
jgi:hypothetical protein